MSIEKTTPTRKKPLPPSRLELQNKGLPPGVPAPPPPPRVQLPRVSDEAMPPIIRETLNSPSRNARNAQLLLIGYIAAVGLAVFAAALLVVGAWWMFRG